MENNYTLEEKYILIKNDIINETSTNPIKIVKNMMKKEYINIHGPEHHFLDGASFIMAIKNALPSFDSNKALEKLKERTIKMPGAMCGYWGICGSTTSIGAVLSIIHEVSPLSNNNFYKDDMKYTSSVIKRMSEIGGPRCCKRNAFLSISMAIDFINNEYNIKLEKEPFKCEFSSLNKDCIKERCLFYNNNK